MRDSLSLTPISSETLTFSRVTAESLAGAVSGRVASSRSAKSHLDCRHRFCSRLRWCCQSSRCRNSFPAVPDGGNAIFVAAKLSSTGATCGKREVTYGSLRETWLMTSVTLERKPTCADSVIYTKAGMLKRFQPRLTADEISAGIWRVGKCWLTHPPPARSAPRRSTMMKTTASCSWSESQWQKCSCRRLRRAAVEVEESCQKWAQVRPKAPIPPVDCFPVALLHFQDRGHRFRAVHLQVLQHFRILPRFLRFREALEVLLGLAKPQPVRGDRWAALRAPGIGEVGEGGHSVRSWLPRYPSRCLGRIPCKKNRASRSSRDEASHSDRASYPLHTQARITYNPKPICQPARTLNPISLSFISRHLFYFHHPYDYYSHLITSPFGNGSDSAFFRTQKHSVWLHG